MSGGTLFPACPCSPSLSVGPLGQDSLWKGNTGRLLEGPSWSVPLCVQVGDRGHNANLKEGCAWWGLQSSTDFKVEQKVEDGRVPSSVKMSPYPSCKTCQVRASAWLESGLDDKCELGPITGELGKERWDARAESSQVQTKGAELNKTPFGLSSFGYVCLLNPSA